MQSLSFNGQNPIAIRGVREYISLDVVFVGSGVFVPRRAWDLSLSGGRWKGTMINTRVRAFVTAGFALCVLMVARPVILRADITGTILGTVRDASGASMP